MHCHTESRDRTIPVNLNIKERENYAREWIRYIRKREKKPQAFAAEAERAALPADFALVDLMYYEYADELLRHIRELVELENGINFTGNEEIAIVLTDEELEIFLDDEGICKRCRKLYMGHDVLLDAQQAQALQEYNIAVNVIPDYYYKELEG